MKKRFLSICTMTIAALATTTMVNTSYAKTDTQSHNHSSLGTENKNVLGRAIILNQVKIKVTQV